MSYRRRHIILAVVLAVVTISYVLGLVLLPRPRSARNAETALLARVQVDDIATVELMNSTSTTPLRLQRLDEQWRVEIAGELFPASDERVNGFLAVVDELTIARTVTRNEEVLADFGLATTTDAQAIGLFDANSQPLARLIFGNVDASGDVYVRFENDSTVYLVANEILFYFDQDDSYWSLLRLFPEDISAANVSSIRIMADDFLIRDDLLPLNADYTLVRQASLEESRWSLRRDAGVAVDHLGVDALAAALVNASGAAFAPDSSLIPDEAVARVEFTLDDGREWQLAIGARAPDDESRFFVRPLGDNLRGYDDGSSYSYYMSVWSLERIVQSLDALVSADPSAESDQ